MGPGRKASNEIEDLVSGHVGEFVRGPVLAKFGLHLVLHDLVLVEDHDVHIDAVFGVHYEYHTADDAASP